MRSGMICPSCGTPNRDEAVFCKYCGFDLRKAPKPMMPSAPPVPPPVAPPAPPVPTGPWPPPPILAPRAWWHGLGVLGIIALFLLFVNVATDRRVTWSPVAILGIAFLAGGIMVLQHFASPDRRDGRSLKAGAALLVAAAVLLPVTLALQTTGTSIQVVTIPYDAGIQRLDLVVTDDAGRVDVAFVGGTGYLARVTVQHVGGFFTSHYEGDVTVTNATPGDTLALTVTAKGGAALLFVGGHDVLVEVQRDLAVSLDLQSATGDVSVDAPAGLRVRGIDARATTGGVSLVLRDAAYEDGATVRATTTTGGVTLDLRQAVASAGTVYAYGTTVTGGVTFRFTPGAGVAAVVRSEVTTGSISFDSAKFEGTQGELWGPSQDAYNGASLSFNVRLSTTTGGIQIG